MLETGSEQNLALEALGTEHSGELGVDHLQSDGAVVLEVVGEEDRRHAAPPKLVLQGVTACKSGLDTVERLLHEVPARPQPPLLPRRFAGFRGTSFTAVASSCAAAPRPGNSDWRPLNLPARTSVLRARHISSPRRVRNRC